jgi:PAS domain S-box-containing protein
MQTSTAPSSETGAAMPPARVVAEGPVMMWMAGRDRQFEWFNPPWLAYTGRTLADERGAGWLDGVHIDDLERCAGIYHASFDERQPFSMDLRLRRHDGAYRWFMASGAPHVTPDGTFHGYSGTCVDIHERKGLEERLAERTRALRLADRRKDEFLAMLAHDLRNPLGPITNAVATMKAMEGDSPAIAPLRRIIERQLDQLKHVIADMRDVTHVTQARPDLHKERIAVDELVRLAVESTLPSIEARGHTLRVEVPAEPVEVWGDRARLSQALAHLLGNAAKFTPIPSDIEVRASVDGGTVRIVVTDPGQGISLDFLPHVFEPFAQETPSSPRTIHGLGVGLTIAKRLAQLHDGDVTGSSDGPGRGACFVLSLPVAPPA